MAWLTKAAWSLRPPSSSPNPRGAPGVTLSCQVLPLPLSLDFLRLVLAVIDDHARSQGHEVIGKVPPSPTPSSSATGISDTPREASLPSATLDVVGTVEVPASLSAVHTTACCLFSVDDLPRLYHGPGMIVRNLARACKGNGSWGKVCGEAVGWMKIEDFFPELL